jgi:hypothetical protein
MSSDLLGGAAADGLPEGPRRRCGDPARGRRQQAPTEQAHHLPDLLRDGCEAIHVRPDEDRGRHELPAERNPPAKAADAAEAFGLELRDELAGLRHHGIVGPDALELDSRQAPRNEERARDVEEHGQAAHESEHEQSEDDHRGLAHEDEAGRNESESDQTRESGSPSPGREDQRSRTRQRYGEGGTSSSTRDRPKRGEQEQPGSDDDQYSTYDSHVERR